MSCANFAFAFMLMSHYTHQTFNQNNVRLILIKVKEIAHGISLLFFT